PLVHQRRDRHAPAVAHAAEPLAIRDANVGEIDLVEVGGARDLLDTPDLDARRFHVEEEVGQALVLGRAGITPRDEHAPVRAMYSPSSWFQITCSMGVPARPPYSFGHVMPAKPASALRR